MEQAMINVASRPRALAVIATVTLACLLVVAVVSAQAGQPAAPQQEAPQEDISRVLAELEARLADLEEQLAALGERLRVRSSAAGEPLDAQLAALQASRERQLVESRRQLESVRSRQLEERALVEGLEEARERARRQMAEVRLATEQTARRAMESARVVQERSRRIARVTMGGCGEYGERILGYAEDLELTADQREQIRAAQRAAQRAGIERRADIEVAAMDLESLYEAYNPDLGAIRAKLEELAMLDVEEQVAGLGLRQQVRQLLTPAQREELEAMGERDDVRIVIAGSTGTRSRVSGFGC
jgi:Spy/CpxP family protein refolding chaperone